MSAWALQPYCMAEGQRLGPIFVVAATLNIKSLHAAAHFTSLLFTLLLCQSIHAPTLPSLVIGIVALLNGGVYCTYVPNVLYVHTRYVKLYLSLRNEACAQLVSGGQ